MIRKKIYKNIKGLLTFKYLSNWLKMKIVPPKESRVCYNVLVMFTETLGKVTHLVFFQKS